MDHNVTGNGERDGLKTVRIGQSAAKHPYVVKVQRLGESRRAERPEKRGQDSDPAVLRRDSLNSRETVRRRKARKCVAAHAERFDDSQFAKEGAKIGTTLKVRLPNMYTVSTGTALSAQDTEEISTTLTVATQKHVDTNFTSAELTLQLQDFMQRIGEPAMSVLAAAVDNDVANGMFDVWNAVGTPGTTPATAKVLLDAHTKMNYLAAPMTPRYVGLEPSANGAMVDGLKGLFNPTQDTSSRFREGMMGENILGYREIYMTQSFPTLTTGARASYQTNTPSGITNGATTLAVDTGTGAAARGEVFTIAGVFSVNPETKVSTGQLLQFTVTAAYAGGGGNISIAPALYKSGARQNFTSSGGDIPDNTALTFLGSASTTYAQNVAYHRDAFTMVTADLVMPEGVHESAREVQDGLSLRYVRQYRIGTDDIPARFDILYGYLTQRGELGCRIFG